MITSYHQGSININQESELYQIEKLNQMLFNNFPDAIYVLDLEGAFSMVNEEICRLTGMERERLLGTSFELLIHPEYRAITREKFQLAIQDKPQRYETAIVNKYLDVTNFPLKAGDSVVAIFGIAKDITEKKQKELDLQKYADLLKVQNEELEVFRKIIAHDLRRPVANAIGFARLIDDPLLPAEKEKEMKMLLLKTVESVDTMVRDLNEVIALRSIGRESKEQVVVQTCLKSLLNFFANDIKNINAEVTLRVAPDLSVFTVKAYFHSILRNLISNALKYHSRHHQPTILVKAVAVENRVEISVTDNGVGMDMARVSKELFKMHRRFAPSLAEGSGLGLYIVHQQVQLLGGSIAVDSAPGAGTAFKIYLPLG